MRIEFRTTAAGPNGTFHAGKVYDVPADQAAPFVDGGYAHEVRMGADQKWERVSPTVPAPAATPAKADKK